MDAVKMPDQDGNFNGLTPAQTERLALIAEECAEVVQVVGKILRHGYESKNPLERDSLTNRQNLEVEVGQLLYALALSTFAGDVSVGGVGAGRRNKAETVARWLHHQELGLVEQVKQAVCTSDSESWGSPR